MVLFKLDLPFIWLLCHLPLRGFCSSVSSEVGLLQAQAARWGTGVTGPSPDLLRFVCAGKENGRQQQAGTRRSFKAQRRAVSLRTKERKEGGREAKPQTLLLLVAVAVHL